MRQNDRTFSCLSTDCSSQCRQKKKSRILDQIQVLTPILFYYTKKHFPTHIVVSKGYPYFSLMTSLQSFYVSNHAPEVGDECTSDYVCCASNGFESAYSGKRWHFDKDCTNTWVSIFDIMEIMFFCRCPWENKWLKSLKFFNYRLIELI